MKSFLRYLITILTNPNHYFSNVRKPNIVKESYNNVHTNTYKSYDDWIYIRTKLNTAKRLDDDTFRDELAYYKFHTFYYWLKENHQNFLKANYSLTKRVREEDIELWYSMSMFNYTKMDHPFCIFQHTSNLSGVPHIPNHIILYYITSNTQDKYNYDLDELNYALNDTQDNHGIFDHQHFYLLPTRSYSNNPLSQALTNLLENLNHIIKYGEFKYLDYDTLIRWGNEYKNIKRAYKTYPDFVEDSHQPLVIILTNTPLQYKEKLIDLSTDEGLQELENKKLIAAYLADQAQENDTEEKLVTPGSTTNIDLTSNVLLTPALIQDNIPATIVSIKQCVNPIQTHLTHEDKEGHEEKDEVVNLFKILMPYLLSILQDKNYNNDIKFHTINLLKSIMITINQ